ncbi:class I SAM-dependent methyltransferase [Syntrophus buswellii]|jgi:SAM-dependent methyltransferase|uniref:class I SAM-dependent methyltransferase n=1 Tax=Syntrophus TaxID=43773 RepID=UPI00345E99A3
MPKAAPFETHHRRYDAWFETHEGAYVSELLALRPFVPWEGRGLEIGVGTGRFAAPLGVEMGLDPSPAMLSHAAARGIRTVAGVAERLPFRDGSFDYALLVTTLCFVDSPEETFAEAYRVLNSDGCLTIGFIDRESSLGRQYEARRDENVFYPEATFYCAEEVERLLGNARFSIRSWAQTLGLPSHETTTIEPLHPGHGEGAFVVVSAAKGR